MSEIDTAQTGAQAAPETPQQQNAGGQTSETAAEQNQQQDSGQEGQQRDEKGRFVPQERVNEITRARRQAERERDALRAQLEQFQAANPPRAQYGQNGPPRIEDFDNLNDWNAATVDYLRQESQQQFRAQQQVAYQQSVAASFEERALSYEAQNPGFDQRFQSLTDAFDIPPFVAESIALSDSGPAVADYLATHMDEADRIFRLPPHLAAIQLGRIEERLSTPRVKPQSNAPSPAPTLGGGSANKKDPANMTDAEWYRSRSKVRE